MLSLYFYWLPPLGKRVQVPEAAHEVMGGEDGQSKMA